MVVRRSIIFFLIVTEISINAQNVCQSQCAVNIQRRESCGKSLPETMIVSNKLPIWKIATHCKNQGCCFDHDDNQCYQPAKSYCPRPRCEAVPLNQRESCLPDFNENRILGVTNCLKLAPTCCWDPLENFCFKKAEVLCPTHYSSLVDKANICGWRYISKPQCLAKDNCCWNPKAMHCVNARIDMPNLVNIFIQSQLEDEILVNISNSHEEIVKPTALHPSLPEEPLEMDDDGEHSMIHAPNSYYMPANVDDKMVYEEFIQIQSNEPVHYLPEHDIHLQHEITKVENTDFRNQIDIILANKEAKDRCFDDYPDTESKNYKTCVMYLMPNLLDLVSDRMYKSESEVYEMQTADRDLARILRSTCFFKYESYELCKVIAMVGRPLKPNPARLENPFTNFNLDFIAMKQSPEIMKNLLQSQFDSFDLKTLLLASSGQQESFDSEQNNEELIKKLAVIKNSDSLETMLMIRLLTDVKNGLNENILAPEGPSQECQETLLVKTMVPNYSQYSYFKSDAKDFDSSKLECEAAGHCWTSYSLDTIISETYGDLGKDKFSTLFSFSRQLDRILGRKKKGAFFSKKCVMKAGKLFRNVAMMTK